jgi:integrase
VAAVKSFLGFAHKVGFTRFNAAPLIKLRKAPRTLAQRLLSDVDVTLLATVLAAMRAGAASEARVFPITERRINYIVKGTEQRAGINPTTSSHWLRHAHASHAIDEGAPITLVSQTLGHADMKTTSVYAHARPNDSSSRYLKRM